VRLAIIGTGIAGMAAAYLLGRQHEITVFEQSGTIGGHANTVTVNDNGRPLGIDTGFVVFNPERYPNLVRLFDQLGVETQETDMSFSVRCHGCNLEYSPQTLRTLFAQTRNLLRPSHYRMIRDGLRAVHDARAFLAESNGVAQSLRGFIAAQGYSRAFADHLLVPLAAAIWSSSPAETLDMPAEFCLRFFDNHRMLETRDKPTWRTVSGGSQSYVRRLTADFRDRIRLNCGIARVRRDSDAVTLTDVHGQSHTFDGVIVAAHADQSLRMLADPSDAERELLGSFSYSRNNTVLHTDASVLPQQRVLHSAWNYELEDCRSNSTSADSHLRGNGQPASIAARGGNGTPGLPRDELTKSNDRHVSLTYYMNRLQRLDAARQYCVTLNRQRPVSEERVLRRIDYEHPIFSRRALEAQRRLPALNGVRRTWYCGAHFGYGFHEDGLASALAVAKGFGITL
jgi:hypothetical protein